MYPLMNDYWEDKRTKTERIDIPVYAVAGYSTSMHTPGTLRGWEDIQHEKKWYVGRIMSFSQGGINQK
jgi:predicted acyl esterase